MMFGAAGEIGGDQGVLYLASCDAYYSVIGVRGDADAVQESRQKNA